MILMTDGLKALAGDSLRNIISRFASGRFSSVAAGTVLTLLVQSSTATTLTTIGFVSSGLLTFQQSIGVIIGANLGTVSTSWMVAILGFNFSITRAAYLFVGIGTLMRLLGRDRLASAGIALAGFGVIFVGIDALQVGMGTLAEQLDPSYLPNDSLLGRLILIGFGFFMTIIMQSSSAAIATTLTALHAGTIDFNQAAALVIGQNIGSAVTSAVAAFGASVPAKRTAIVHVLFNVAAALVAFALLTPFVEAVKTVAQGNEEIALAVFHTVFKLIGAAIFIPLMGTIATTLTRYVPDRGPALTRTLDPILAQEPQAAVEAAHGALIAVLVEQSRIARSMLQFESARDLEPAISTTQEALTRTTDFLAGVSGDLGKDGVQRRRLAVAHSIDHLCSLGDALGDKNHLDTIREAPGLRAGADELATALGEIFCATQECADSAAVQRLGSLSAKLADSRRNRREEVLSDTAASSISPELALRQLDAIRWIDRVGYHVWRASAHLFSSDTKELHRPAK
jgi:phosphate:Na+ symporter